MYPSRSQCRTSGPPSIVLADVLPIESATGIQQGEPLGPLLFPLAVDDAPRSVKSKYKVYYLDDATIYDDVDVSISDDVGTTVSDDVDTTISDDVDTTIYDDVDTVVTDIISITNLLCMFGLVVNPSKSEFINVNYPEHHF